MQERGDQLVVETLPFESTLQIEPPLIPGVTPDAGEAHGRMPLLPDKSIARPCMTGGGAAAALLALAFVAFRLLLRGQKRKQRPSRRPNWRPETPRLGALRSPAAHVQQNLEAQLAERDALQQKSDAQMLSSLKLAPVITKKAEVMAKHLRDKIDKEPEVSAQILRTWIREEEQ